MADESRYILRDQHGVIRVGESRVMLDGIIVAWEEGHSPESIRAQYPALTLEEVYGAITWSLSHPDELADYMKRQDAAWELGRARSESRTDALRDRLRSARGLSQER